MFIRNVWRHGRTRRTVSLSITRTASRLNRSPIDKIQPAGLLGLNKSNICKPGPLIEARALRPSRCFTAGSPPSPQSGRWRPTRTIKSMTTRLARHRARAYFAQRALCYYCQCKMYIGNPSEFALSHGLSDRQVRQVQCTAEHLTAQRDGGTDARSNIAAVCWHCNRLRHARKTPLSANRYRDYVRKKIAGGAWHDKLLLLKLCSSGHSSQ